MGQVLAGGFETQVRLCPVVPPSCASQWHHSRNGPGSCAQPYHRVVPVSGTTVGMGQVLIGGFETQVSLCPAVPPSYASQGHHNRNGPGSCAQPYHRAVSVSGTTAEMGQVLVGGFETQVSLCPAVPSSCASQGHHSRNGPDSRFVLWRPTAPPNCAS